ncbi:MAG: AraC family transcriptional regulator [Flavobacterium sp.]|nr:AraC family transcriptional regulator [Flavobacterium sp.]
MKLFLKVDQNFLANKILAEKLDGYNLKYTLVNATEVLFLENVPSETYAEICKTLNEYGFEVIENQKNILVQRIKDLITEVVQKEEALNVKFSSYLSDNLGHSYGYLSNLFSEVTYTSIENFIILQKIEVAKQLIANEKMSLTEIAFRLNYSSVAHLSSQFKNTTGITPSAFQRIIKKRRELINNAIV